MILGRKFDRRSFDLASPWMYSRIKAAGERNKEGMLEAQNRNSEKFVFTKITKGTVEVLKWICFFPKWLQQKIKIYFQLSH